MDEYKTLIDRVKQGDEEAFNIIYENNKRMIYKIINNQVLRKGDYLIDEDSLFQEGSIALYKAVFSYEDDKGMTFTSYAYMVIRMRILTYIRDNMRVYEDEYYSIDNIENVDYYAAMANFCVSENPIEYHREQEFEKKLSKFVSTLNSEDKAIFELRSDNMSYKEIASRLNINHKRIDNRLRSLRIRLKRYLDNDR